ncbi:hypothetical protein AGMMS49574_10200 [Bacteroidia bacterium]|nr:hypothetical protein AGMMS49574_10200 [Bacteroidia bacterium]
MEKKKMKKVLLVAGITLVSFVVILPTIAFCTLNWGILPPKKLTPLVEREVNKLINGHLACERAELTFFKTYPYLGVQLSNGLLSSYVTMESESEPDSLLAFHEIVVSVNLMDYLFDNKITIRDILLDQPHIHTFADITGRTNWMIIESDTIASADTTALPPIDIQRIRIKDGHFSYQDLAAEMLTEVEGFNLELTGSLLEEGGNTFEIETSASSFLFESPSYTLQKDLALHFKSTVELRDNFNTVTLHNTEFKLNELPFTADGSITILPETGNLGINLETTLKASDMNDILAFIPDAYFKNRSDLKATGSIVVEGQVNGELGEDIIPTIDLCCIVENGSFYMKGVKQGIDSLEMDIDLHIDGENLDASYASIEKLLMEGLNTNLDIHGKVTNLMQSPAIDACIQGNIDFTRLTREFLDPDTFLLEGFINGDIDAAFAIDDVMNGRYDKIVATGVLDVDSLKAVSAPFDINVFISKAHFAIDSTQATSSFIKNSNLLSASLTIDSLNIKYKESINTNISRLVMTAKTSLVMDTTEVTSITSAIRFAHLQTRLPDSTWVMARQATIRGGIKPSESNKRIPSLGASIQADTLRYFAIPLRTGVTFAGSTLSIQAMPYRDAMRERRQTLLASRASRGVAIDSTRIVATRLRTDSTRLNPSDSTNVRRIRRAPVDSTAKAPAEQPFLQNWEVRGSIAFNQMRLNSRLFPLRMLVDATQVAFDTNKIKLSKARFHAGKSDFTLDGELNSLRRAMLRGGKLDGTFTLTSDYIDCNELIQAMSQGMQYSDQSMNKTEIAALNNGDLADLTASVAVQDSIPVSEADSSSLFVVPAFLDIALNMTAKHVDYKDLEMEDVEGEVVVRNQSINLKKLEMNSNIGNGNLTMFYTAKDLHGGSAGFDLDMQGILVDKLINLYPSIDSLLPMLRSFQGVVDCQMMATCQLDSTMSIDLSSLNTACFLRGKNMVLLDGETFTEIAKTLKFKNKNRNEIDSISVDLAIRNKKIEIFPFLFEMDRYRVAVGGTHNLDMTFDYHVSVLKSPLPINIGVDISGNVDKFKYKLVKCRYKDTFNPAKEQELVSTKINLREGLRDLIRKQIVENAPELAITTPAVVVTDSVSLSYNP